MKGEVINSRPPVGDKKCRLISKLFQRSSTREWDPSDPKCQRHRRGEIYILGRQIREAGEVGLLELISKHYMHGLLRGKNLSVSPLQRFDVVDLM